MKRLMMLLALSLLTTGCYIGIIDPTAGVYKNPYDYVLYVEADQNVSWSGTLDGQHISGRGRRAYSFNRLPACWSVSKSSYDGLLRVYVQRRGYSQPKFQDQATYRAYHTLSGCFR